VVGVGHVLVDALFDEAQPKDADVEVDALLRIAGYAGDVVDAGYVGCQLLDSFNPNEWRGKLC
jgi:hypothetical protein